MKKILIIEDEKILGEILLQKLSAIGYQVELIRDGALGEKRMCDWVPDLILLDLMLPTINGLEILEQKRDNKSVTDIPTIVLTNSFHPVTGTEIEKLGVTDFMIKSNIAPEEIINKINNILNNMQTNTNEENNGTTPARKKILIVEDDDFLASILLSRLSADNATVIIAKSGEDALIELNKEVPQAVLLDILLPGINGFEVLKVIRENPLMINTPVTVISNFDQPKDKEQAKIMNADYLVKALVTPDDIADKVHLMLGITK